jgi:hypothetical protein
MIAKRILRDPNFFLFCTKVAYPIIAKRILRDPTYSNKLPQVLCFA